MTFKIGDLVSSNPFGSALKHFMPGVGKIIDIYKCQDTEENIYVCSHNNLAYYYKEDEIYEFDPY
jgi:hypothetical protein